MRLNNQPFFLRITFLAFKTELMLAGAIGVLSLHINQKTEKAKASVGPECLTGHHRGTTSQTKTSQQADCVGL